MDSPPSLIQYTDFRRFLRDWFDFRKGRPSQNGFAKRVPCSAALVSSVVSGTRNLGRARAERFANVLKFDEEERTFFLTLVSFAEAESPADRDRAWATITARRRWDDTAALDDATYQVFTNWLYPVIIEMSRWPNYRPQPEWLAQHIRPQVDPEEVAKALAWMESQGLLGRDADGKHAALADNLSSGHLEADPFRGHVLARHHQDALDLVKARLPQTKVESRHYTTMTFAATQSRVDEVKRGIRQLIEAATVASIEETAPDRVMMLAVQLAPLASDGVSTEHPASPTHPDNHGPDEPG